MKDKLIGIIGTLGAIALYVTGFMHGDSYRKQLDISIVNSAIIAQKDLKKSESEKFHKK